MGLESTICISYREVRLPAKVGCPGCETELHLLVKLQFWRYGVTWSTLNTQSLELLPGVIWPQLVVYDMLFIEEEYISLQNRDVFGMTLNIIFWSGSTSGGRECVECPIIAFTSRSTLTWNDIHW